MLQHSLAYDSKHLNPKVCVVGLTCETILPSFWESHD